MMNEIESLTEDELKKSREPFMSIHEVMKVLNLSKSTVYRLIWTGSLKAYAITVPNGLDDGNSGKGKTGAYRISRKQLDEFLMVNGVDNPVFLVGNIRSTKSRNIRSTLTLSDAINQAFKKKKSSPVKCQTFSQLDKASRRKTRSSK